MGSVGGGCVLSRGHRPWSRRELAMWVWVLLIWLHVSATRVLDLDAACLCPLYATIGATYRLETIERLERPNRCAARTLRCAFSSHKKPCRNIPLYRFSSVILTALNLELKPKLQGNNLNPREHIDKIHRAKCQYLACCWWN
jgi:hypothetical protein